MLCTGDKAEHGHLAALADALRDGETVVSLASLQAACSAAGLPTAVATDALRCAGLGEKRTPFAFTWDAHGGEG